MVRSCFPTKNYERSHGSKTLFLIMPLEDHLCWKSSVENQFSYLRAGYEVCKCLAGGSALYWHGILILYPSDIWIWTAFWNSSTLKMPPAIGGPVGYTPPDGGWGWAVVVGAFISIGFSYAFPKSITVFFKEIEGIFNATTSEVSWISSIMLAVMYGGGKNPQACRFSHTFHSC